jgi:hypothetical protein
MQALALAKRQTPPLRVLVGSGWRVPTLSSAAAECLGRALPNGGDCWRSHLSIADRTDPRVLAVFDELGSATFSGRGCTVATELLPAELLGCFRIAHENGGDGGAIECVEPDMDAWFRLQLRRCASIDQLRRRLAILDAKLK